MNRISPTQGSEKTTGQFFSIPHRFEEMARAYAGKTALVSGTEHLTYAELNRKAAQLASVLHSRGAAPGTRVALLLPDDVPLIVGWLGVLKSGAMCVPLPSGHPPKLLQSILESAKPLCLVTNRSLRPLAEETSARIPLLQIEELPSPHSEGEPSPAVPRHQEAYILYTSGTTGKPKGVVQTHRNLLHNVRQLGERMHIAPEDRMAVLSSMAMGQGVATLFIALLHGASLHPFPLKEQGFEALGRWLSGEAISIHTSSVTVFRRLAESLPSPFPSPALRVIRLGTEELRKQDVDLFKDRFPPGTVLLNCLGATETMNYAAFEIRHDTVIPGESVPVGIPPEDTTLELLPGKSGNDDTGGEIAVRSEFLSPGYWEDPVLTAEKFRISKDGSRCYLTGDLGRRREDGSLIFAGRVDDQIKIRGNRVEPARIESLLRLHPEVREAAVSLQSYPDTRLVAYVVAALDPVELRTYLSKHLPDFMIPSEFVFMESLPLTPSGKVDRQALQMARPAARNTSSSALSLDETEKALACCWKAVLDAAPFGAEDDFFTVGGDSVKAMELFTKIRSSMGIGFHLADFPGGFNIRQMAAAAKTKPRQSLPPAGEAPGYFLVRLKNKGTECPIFLIPGGYGGDMEIQLMGGLADSLRTQQPVMGIRSGARLSGRPFARTLENHAGEVLAEIRSAGFKGKWHLAGECLAAPVALAVASAAEAAGTHCGPLILIDPWTPGPVKKGFLSGIAAYWNRRFSKAKTGIHRFPKVAAYYHLAQSAVPPKIKNDIHLVIGTDHPDTGRLLEYWHFFTHGRLHVHRIADSHHKLIREYPGRTASILQSVWERGQSGDPATA